MRRYDESELPEWARLHIPDEPLTAEQPGRRSTLRFTRAAVNARSASVATDEPKEPRGSKRAVLVLASGVVIAVTSALAGVALATPDNGRSVEIPAPVSTDQGVVIAVGDFCPDSTNGAATTTSGPGSESTAAGVIAAFDYAYYTERAGQKVADLMVNPPSTVPVIQAAIDAVATGTRACVTTRPTSDPLVFLVDVSLQAPTGPAGELRQRITVTQTGPTFKIARVEDR
ncbi:MAG: hypothetical protein LLG14_22625 [Nocardiaceae bacterium]|nr:hypothetical protein [Nocardiaceae bacterium]